MSAKLTIRDHLEAAVELYLEEPLLRVSASGSSARSTSSGGSSAT